jgi:peptidyl-prolyl cis-trans isomerase C
MKHVVSFSTLLLTIFIVAMCLFESEASVAASRCNAAGARKKLSPAVVATVNHIRITRTDIDDAVAASGERDTIALRRTLKHRLIALELLRQAAAELHYTNAEQAMHQATPVERTIVAIQLYLRDTVRPAPVSERDIETRYRLIANSLSVLTQEREICFRAKASPATAIRPQRYAFRAVAEHDRTPRCDRLHAWLWPSSGEEGTESVPLSTAGQAAEIPMKCPCTWPISVRDGGGGFGVDAMTAPDTPGLLALRDGIRRQLETERFNQAVHTLVESLMKRASIVE